MQSHCRLSLPIILHQVVLCVVPSYCIPLCPLAITTVPSPFYLQPHLDCQVSPSTAISVIFLDPSPPMPCAGILFCLWPGGVGGAVGGDIVGYVVSKRQMKGGGAANSESSMIACVAVAQKICIGRCIVEYTYLLPTAFLGCHCSGQGHRPHRAVGRPIIHCPCERDDLFQSPTHVAIRHQQSIRKSSIAALEATSWRSSKRLCSR